MYNLTNTGKKSQSVFMSVDNNQIDLSIVIPSINPDKWVNIYDSLNNKLGKYTFELIFVGPATQFLSSEYKNIKYIRDFGCPSRAVQLGTTMAEGKLITWLSDDAEIIANNLEEAISQWEKQNNNKTIINLIYTEGDQYKNGEDPRMLTPYLWYKPHFHAEMRNLYGINQNWYSITFGLLTTEYFRYLGGFDCRFEHINFNIHDFIFRAQRDECNLTFSNLDKPIARFPAMTDLDEPRTIENCPIIQAQTHNDLPLFKSIYINYENMLQQPVCIDYNNWKKADRIWKRKYGENGET